MVPQVIFWVCVGVIAYTYLGYPLLLWVLSLLAGRRAVPEMTDWPRLSALIVAHNEEDNIRNKINNILASGYPEDRLEVIVCSDGSTDNTNKLVSDYGDPRVKLVASSTNIGVNEALALGAGKATGDLLLMTDAGALFEEGAILKVVGLFADPEIGLATGRILYRNPLRSSIGSGYSAYWSVETRVRELEARLGLAVVIVGAFEMIRPEAYLPVPSKYNNDMIAPMYAISKGFRAGFRSDALLVTVQKKDPQQELARRVRMAVRGWSSVPYLLRMVPFLKNLASWLALISHKYLRWTTWVFMIATFVTSGLLMRHRFFQVTFALQTAFYLLALVGWLLVALGVRLKALLMPFYFCLLQVGGMIGLILALSGRRVGVWKPVE